MPLLCIVEAKIDDCIAIIGRMGQRLDAETNVSVGEAAIAQESNAASPAVRPHRPGAVLAPRFVRQLFCVGDGFQVRRRKVVG